MKLARYHNSPATNPFQGLDSFLGFPASGFSPLFDFANRLSRVPWEGGLVNSDTPSLFEDDENFYARFELPGVKKDALSVELNGNQLELSVSHEGEGNARSLSLTVPEGVDPEKISAKLEDGILTVTLAKSEAQKPRSIEVK